jgi:hypothetical protein
MPSDLTSFPLTLRVTLRDLEAFRPSNKHFHVKNLNKKGEIYSAASIGDKGSRLGTGVLVGSKLPPTSTPETSKQEF